MQAIKANHTLVPQKSTSRFISIGIILSILYCVGHICKQCDPGHFKLHPFRMEQS